MDNITLENFINFCDDMMIANEGFKININTIFKNLLKILKKLKTIIVTFLRKHIGDKFNYYSSNKTYQIFCEIKKFDFNDASPSNVSKLNELSKEMFKETAKDKDPSKYEKKVDFYNEVSPVMTRLDRQIDIMTHKLSIEEDKLERLESKLKISKLEDGYDLSKKDDSYYDNINNSIDNVQDMIDNLKIKCDLIKIGIEIIKSYEDYLKSS